MRVERHGGERKGAAEREEVDWQRSCVSMALAPLHVKSASR